MGLSLTISGIIMIFVKFPVVIGVVYGIKSVFKCEHTNTIILLQDIIFLKK